MYVQIGKKVTHDKKKKKLCCPEIHPPPPPSSHPKCTWKERKTDTHPGPLPTPPPKKKNLFVDIIYIYIYTITPPKERVSMLKLEKRCGEQEVDAPLHSRARGERGSREEMPPHDHAERCEEEHCRDKDTHIYIHIHTCSAFKKNAKQEAKEEEGDLCAVAEPGRGGGRGLREENFAPQLQAGVCRAGAWGRSRLKRRKLCPPVACRQFVCRAGPWGRARLKRRKAAPMATQARSSTHRTLTTKTSFKGTTQPNQANPFLNS